MDLNEVEAVIQDAVQAAGAFELHSTRDGRYLDVTVRLANGSDSDQRAQAKIWTAGVEAFFVELPGGFVYREFDWQREGQLSALLLLSNLATQYLLGRYEKVEEYSSFLRRRPQPYIEISVHGKHYKLYAGKKSP